MEGGDRQACPKPEVVKDRAYLNWLKVQKCVRCNRPADDPHHLIGRSRDDVCTPCCRPCHDFYQAHKKTFAEILRVKADWFWKRYNEIKDSL